MTWVRGLAPDDHSTLTPRMSNPFVNSATDDVLYPDDLPGRKFKLIGDEPIKASEIDHRDAKYGYFTEVRSTEQNRVWISSPKQLRLWIGNHYNPLKSGTWFEVLDVNEGELEHDEYEIEARLVQEGDPL